MFDFDFKKKEKKNEGKDQHISPSSALLNEGYSAGVLCRGTTDLGLTRGPRGVFSDKGLDCAQAFTALGR